jgi:Ni/Fe-hydrogenase subunit HybB-like protein
MNSSQPIGATLPSGASAANDEAATEILAGRHDYASISDHIGDAVLKGPGGRWWTVAIVITSALTLLFFGSIGYLFAEGVGIWGLNVPVVWAYDITNYVWWIAIAMSGTFISAALHLTHQEWGISISRFAEAMTIFALAIAGMFPIIHLGRPWFFYWLAPYPNVMSLWPQWRSPLVWDFFAILAYLLLSLMFWYMGLLPDIATLRDRARSGFGRVFYGLLALGWRGEAHHWQERSRTHLLLAGMAVPLVVSVHSVVGLDFATGNTPGWHSTIFPPFFVAGAMFSGFAMAMTIAVLLRRAFRLEEFITDGHLDKLAKLILAMGLILAYSYLMEVFMAWYGGNRYEEYTALNRMRGPYAPVYWSLILCVVVIPQALWFRRVRRSPWTLFGISLVINVGMWLERFMLIVTSLHRDFLPSAWGMFYPTVWDWAILFGSIGFFAWMFLLFIRILPAISMSDMRELLARRGGPLPEGNAVATPAAPEALFAGTGGQHLHGLVAEFADGAALLQAARSAHGEGYRRMEACSPMAVAGLDEALGRRGGRSSLLALAGGLIGGLSALGLQWYSVTHAYPINVGARTPIWPGLVPSTFEMTLLGAALFVFFGMLREIRLPRLNHPLFDLPEFARVSRDRFFLCIEAADPQFDAIRTRYFLERLAPLQLTPLAAASDAETPA